MRQHGGFEVYVDDWNIGGQLWDELFAQGQDLQVRAGCPNLIERLESSLLSFGNDMDFNDTPFDCGLDRYVSLQDDIDSLSIAALRKYASNPQKILLGLLVDQPTGVLDPAVRVNGTVMGEVRSQAWSPRYQCHLATAMCERELIAGLRLSQVSVSVDGQSLHAQLHSLPFDLQMLGN